MAIGLVLHYVVPPIVLGMKPDLLLSMLFIVLLMESDPRLAMEAGIIGGILTALTTGFPGGQIPNLIDKIVTTLVMMGLIRVMRPAVGDKLLPAIVGVVGTILSGAVFLGSAALIVGLPGPFKVLFTSVVLPAALVNTIALVILYPLVVMSDRAVHGRGHEVKAGR
ncbi:MAG TPA: tryptophan transporter [Firmicutes bacterium]|nr:tryptophan transporter [Bacillota bacterium]